MEFIIEEILSFLLESSIEVSADKRKSKWIRYPLIAFIMLFFVAVIGVILLAGVLSLKENVLMSVFCFAVAAVIVVGAVIKFRKVYGRIKK